MRQHAMTADGIHNQVLAVETHAGRIWGLLILPGIIGLAVGAMFYPPAPGRIALIAILVVMIGALALVLSGFQYRFLQQGVEVRTLGFRLRAIPKQTILGYSIEAWSLPRGYGIRGLGNTRAYVWGNKVVHIRTTNGEIYLGHDDPGRIVRDLDRVTGFASPS
jgi:hypothetical protein